VSRVSGQAPVISHADGLFLSWPRRTDSGVGTNSQLNPLGQLGGGSAARLLRATVTICAGERQQWLSLSFLQPEASGAT